MGDNDHQKRPASARLTRHRAIFAVALLVLVGIVAAAASAGTSGTAQTIKVGLITKTDANPFFVKMREGAQQAAKKNGVQLLTAAGRFPTDNASQVTAIENMTTAGAKAILIVAADTKAIVPAISRARAKGVLVIALDSPTQPRNATDALFATDNFKAGVLIGKYARAATRGKPVKIAMLDLAPGVTVGVLRHNGFLKGFGIKNNDRQIVCTQFTQGERAKAQTAMENCLQKEPGINVVFTFQEPDAAAAYEALRRAGKAKGVLIVSVDGGCDGVRLVRDGKVAATSQQYPLRMAALGVQAGVRYAKNGKKPATFYLDTGVNLIAKRAVARVPSKGVAYGLANCWG
jgi:fructose transport system substrate-binding protein